MPAIAASLMIVVCLLVAIPVIHQFTAGLLWQRIVISLCLIVPGGMLLGFCFPAGTR